MPMKTTFNSSFTNPSFSLSFIGVDRFRLLLKGCGLKVLSLLLVVMVGGMSWGQTTIFNYQNTTATIPSNWVLTNNIASQSVDKTTYLLLEPGSPSDQIVTPNYDLSSYSNVVLSYSVATYSGPTPNPAMRLEVSTNGGTSWSATTYTSVSPTSSTYVNGTISVTGQIFTSTTKFRFSNTISTTTGIRLQNLKITATAQATSITSGTPNSNSIPSITCAVGSGAIRAIFMAAASTGSAVPLNSTTYTANTIFGSGTQIGATGWYCVFNGTGTPNVTVSGLSASTTYRVMVCEYDGAAGAEVYNTYTSGVNNPVNIITAASSSSTLTASGTLSAISTTYGTASGNSSFTISGSSLDGTAVTATSPAGFEISTSSSFTSVGTSSSPLALGSSASFSNTIYVRLAATTSAGSYSGNVVISGGGASSVNVATVTSTVSKKALTISGLTAGNKVYDGGTSVTINGSPAYSGLMNGESFSVVGTPTWLFTTKTVGTNKSITQSGSYDPPSSNYTVTQPTLTANITAKSLSVLNATVTSKTYDGTTSATLSGSLSGVISPDAVTLIGTGTYASANVGTGISVTSTSTLSGAEASNYTLTQPTGLSGNITIASQTIIFGALSNATTSTADFSPGASASSGLSVTYVSSNTSVATIVSGNIIHIVGTGTTNITASQPGNTNYTAAADVVQTLNVIQAPIVLAGWDFSTNYAASALTANYVASNVTVSNLDKGSGGSYYSVSSGPPRWGKNGVSNSTSLATAITAGSFTYFTISANTGYKLSLSNIPAQGIYSTNSGPGSEQVQFSINGTTFTSIGNNESLPYLSNAVSAVDLSASSQLQNVPSGVTITYRMVMYNGGTGAGGYYDYNSPAANDLVLKGYVDCATPAAPTVNNFIVTYDGNAKSVTASTTAIAGTTPTVDWYSAASGGSALLSGSLTSPNNTNAGTYIYYAEARNTVCGAVSATRTQVTITINKATPTLSISNSTVTYTGSSQSATVTGTGGGVVSNVLYDGSATVPIYAGTYAVTADIAASINYNAAIGASAGTFTIIKATPTLSIGNSPQIYSGSSIAATVSGSVAGVVSNVKYGGSLTVPTNAGTYAITANLVPTDGTNYNSLTDASAGNFVISKADQSITFASTNSILSTAADYDPGATSTTSGVNPITYASSNLSVATIVSGNIHVIGAGQTTITASQASSTNYNAASATQTLTVNAATSITTQPVGYTILATGTSPSALSVTASGTNLTYQWYSNTVNSTTNATLITSATNASYTPPATSGAMYYYVVVHGDYGSDVTSDVVAVVISDIFTWNGSVSSDWNTAANWTPAGVPPTTAVVSVPNCTNDPLNGSLTIASGGSVTLASGTMLTLSGIITNNGTLTIESGATLVQTGSGTNAGNGTYNVKQTVSGSGGSTPNGRFWYLGGAVSDAASTALLTSNGNQLWQWNESSFSYATVASGQALTQGKSYVLRSGQANETINFTGSNLSNGTVTVSGLTRTGTTQTYRGCHLISNPYPSYLDWNSVTKTNIGTTMYVRTASGSTLDVLETYNSANGQGTNISGPTMTQYIAPMQGFWVKVSADGQTGSLTMNNSMRSHQSSGSGLRSSAIDFPAYLRFNMIDGQNKDQVILLMSPDATMSLDAFDSEKMPASGYGQFYSTVNAKKLVINGMKNVKAKTSVPLTLELPTSKSYTFQAEEFNIEDGLILLEDKQEGIIQDLTINPTYTFFSNAGTNATRFVVHFQLASAPVLVGGPQELENLGMDQLSTDNIQITSNNQGTVIIRLDERFKPEGSIRIFDASGRLVEQRDFNDQETTIQLNEQAGMYFVEVSAGKLMVKKKIVIN